MEEIMHTVLSGASALDSEAFGPATHVVLVHPSTPWSAFIKALCNHVGLDPKRALSAGEAPLSPRSPLLPFGPSVDFKTPISGAGAGKSADAETWAFDALRSSGADQLYHTTFLHIDFLDHAYLDLPPIPVLASPSSMLSQSPAPPASSGPRASPLAVSGGVAERVLARMPDESVALLVIDPAGAIFADPRAIRAIAAVVSVLRKSPRVNTGATGNRPPRLQLASAVGGADWAQIAAAFGRVAGLLPDAPADARAVSEAVLESARLHYSVHWPLLHLFASRASFSLDVECGWIAGPGGGFDGGLYGGSYGGCDGEKEEVGAQNGGAAGRPARHVLPGQIETAERLAVARVADPDADLDDGDAEGSAVAGDSGGGGRGQGPDSQSGVARFARDLFGGRAAPSLPPPAVPPADAASLTLVRRSRSLTEASITVCTSARQAMLLKGRGSGSAQAAANPPSNTSARCPGGAAATGIDCFPPAGGGIAPYIAPYIAHAGSVLSAASARSLHPMSSTTTAARVCLSNPSTTNNPLASTPATAAAGGSAAGAAAGAGVMGMYASAMASMASSICGGGSLDGTGGRVACAVEAARRYAALLEGVGLWAPAAGTLEACLCAVGERWGHRSGRMAALLTQLGRLQQRQGLYRAAEVTWRQALEALESIHGPEGVPVLECRVALAQVLAALREPDAETMLRAALAALDAALGPAAPETLAARRALGGFLAGETRWMEAEVVYQGLLQAMEEAPPPPVRQPPARVGAALTVRQRQGSSTLSSHQQRGVSRAPSRASSLQQLLTGSGSAGGQGRSSEVQGSGGGGGGGRKAPPKSDSRSRMAWGAYPDAAGAAGSAAVPEGGGAAVAAPCSPGPGGGFGTSGTFHRTVLPPLPSGSGGLLKLASAAICPSPLPPVTSPDGGGAAAAPLPNDVAQPSAATPRGPSGGGGGGRLGPGNADLLSWSGVAAGLADTVAAVQREYGGMNDLYEGMHLAGPEGSTAADLAALAAVCPRSGACIAAVVNVRRLTDAGALYDVAITARRAFLDAAHPAMLDLQVQYARHLSSIGEHGRAQAVCRAALEQLSVAPPPLRRQTTGGLGGAGSTAAAAHPAEVSLRHALGAVLLAAGSLAAATAALTSAVEVAERLVSAGDLAAADSRRVEALDCLSGVLWQRAQAATTTTTTTTTSEQEEEQAAAAEQGAPVRQPSFASRAIECKRQALELTAAVCGERHERVMRGWVALGQMLEAAGDLAAAERAYEAAAEVALHRHSRLSAATKAIFRQLQRVYQAQGRTADAQILGHMYRLKGGLLSAAAAPSPPPAIAAPAAPAAVPALA